LHIINLKKIKITKQTKYRKLLLAQYIETQVTVRGADITWLMGKPLSYWDYDKLADSLIDILSDTEWHEAGLSEDETIEIYNMAANCYKDRQKAEPRDEWQLHAESGGC